MTIIGENDIREMYSKRLERAEIKKMPSESTIKKHASNILNLSKQFYSIAENEDPHTNTSMEDWLIKSDIDSVFDKIKKMPGKNGNPIGLSAQQSYLFSTLVGIRTIDFDNFHKNNLFISINKLLKEEKGLTQQLYEHKRSKSDELPDYEKIQELVNTHLSDNKDYSSKRLNLIMRIYLLYPFRLEVADLIYIKGKKEYKNLDKKGNYLVKDSKGLFFSFNDYKTSDTYKERVIRIENTLLRARLTSFIKENEIGSGERLWSDLSRNTMTKQVTKFFSDRGIKKVTPTILTKLLIKKKYEEMPQGLKEIQQELARQRGHSIDTQLQIYLYEN